MRTSMPRHLIIKLFGMCAFFLIFVYGCSDGADSPRGFSLPVGEVEKGKLVFIKFQCVACHEIDSQSVNSMATDPTIKELEKSVKLGGSVNRVKTYADLVTSIINPSHRIAKKYQSEIYQTADGVSKMKNYNNVMTVEELINVVAFLQPRYDLVEYHQTNYAPYP